MFSITNYYHFLNEAPKPSINTIFDWRLQETKRHQILHILLPLTIGGLLYILFRDNGLLMFEWFNVLGVTDIIDRTRALTLQYKQSIPDWTIYSLPDALWTYSLTTTMIFNWNRTFNRSSAFWILMGLTFATLLETAQYFGLLQGTFDIIDLTLCFIASILALTHINNISIKPKDNENSIGYTS